MSKRALPSLSCEQPNRTTIHVRSRPRASALDAKLRRAKASAPAQTLSMQLRCSRSLRANQLSQPREDRERRSRAQLCCDVRQHAAQRAVPRSERVVANTNRTWRHDVQPCAPVTMVPPASGGAPHSRRSDEAFLGEPRGAATQGSVMHPLVWCGQNHAGEVLEPSKLSSQQSEREDLLWPLLGWLGRRLFRLGLDDWWRWLNGDPRCCGGQRHRGWSGWRWHRWPGRRGLHGGASRRSPLSCLRYVSYVSPLSSVGTLRGRSRMTAVPRLPGDARVVRLPAMA